MWRLQYRQTTRKSERGRMKKELLRVRDLSAEDFEGRRVEHVSFYGLAGEVAGFLGLAYSGKDVLVQVLKGESDTTFRKAILLLEGKQIEKSEDLKRKVYAISKNNYRIDTWTVAEYIGLVEESARKWIWKRAELAEKIETFLEHLQIPIAASKKLRELTELEKRIIDVGKARYIGASILIIEDELEGMNKEQIHEFSGILHKLIKDHIYVVVNSYSAEVLSGLCDRFFILKKGKIVKICRKAEIKDWDYLERFWQERKNFRKAKEAEKETLRKESDLAYQVSEKWWNREKDLRFFKGEVVTILLLDRKKKEKLFERLAANPGKEKDVVAVRQLGSEEELFQGMKVGENLMLPSMEKISAIEYISSSKKIEKALCKEMGDIKEPDTGVEKLEVNEIIRVTLERWYIYNPKVLLLLEPFYRCDVHGVFIVKSYIKKFTAKGTAVVIVKSREEYVEEISDRLLYFD